MHAIAIIGREVSDFSALTGLAQEYKVSIRLR